LVAFDVPPFSHDYSLAHLGVFPNYYSPENMLSFIDGLVDLKKFMVELNKKLKTYCETEITDKNLQKIKNNYLVLRRIHLAPCISF
jgi:hypothetical protein